MSGSNPVYQGIVVDVYREHVDLPNGHHAEFELVSHPGGALAAAVDREGRVCLLRQYRHAVGTWIWELPAGLLEPGEQPQVAAMRELEEEAGRRAARWDSLGRTLTSPGVFNEVLHLFLARELTAVETNHEPMEMIEVHWLPLSQALRMAESGEILDAKTVVGLVRAQAVLARA